MKRITFALAGLLCLAACKKPAPPPEPAPPQPKAGTAAEQVGVSSQGLAGQTLNAPGNYMRGMVGHIDEAKKAVAAANKKEAELIDMDPSRMPGDGK